MKKYRVAFKHLNFNYCITQSKINDLREDKGDDLGRQWCEKKRGSGSKGAKIPIGFRFFPVLTAVTTLGCYLISFYIDSNDEMRVLTKLQRLNRSNTDVVSMVRCEDRSLLLFCKNGDVMNVYIK